MVSPPSTRSTSRFTASTLAFSSSSLPFLSSSIASSHISHSALYLGGSSRCSERGAGEEAPKRECRWYLRERSKCS